MFEVDEKPVEAAGGGSPVGVVVVGAGGADDDGLDDVVEDVGELVLMSALDVLEPVRTESGRGVVRRGEEVQGVGPEGRLGGVLVGWAE